ncbi:carboxypeptidase a2-like protein [Dermatophagoides farinae]|uniref:Carboxypeptidase a2-like protein n=1 Tax=Dermatophagoides farinae TaxID=6954 RepID=A0A9D4NUM1_DERFA|nr:carboxypeptidase a2-like protein [Dermatophagoides farinae]
MAVINMFRPENERKILNQQQQQQPHESIHDQKRFSTIFKFKVHSIIKISNLDLHKIFDNQNDHHRNHQPDDNHEILWYDQSDMNNTYAFVRIGPKSLKRVRRDLRYLREQPVFVTTNLQSWLDAEQQHSYHPYTTFPKNNHVIKLLPTFVLNRYYPIAQVNRYLHDVANLPDSSGITLFTIGHTHENRPIQAIEILNNPNDPNFLWIDGCTHAREWVTVTTALYIIDQAIYTKIPINFIIVPILNVDGYVYTWTKDRMWRKNRRPYIGSRLSRHSMPERCTGVDLNRNYDINFGGTGSSPKPFSEPEVRAASDLLSKNRNRIKMTLSLHSFNQLWSCPNAFTTDMTKDHNHHMRILRSIQQAVRQQNGILYDIGPLGSRLYLGSGFMMDWIYHKLGIRDAYLVELRDRGYYGFILPADQILPTATETWAGIQVAIQQIFL